MSRTIKRSHGERKTMKTRQNTSERLAIAPCLPPNVLWLQFRGDGDPCDDSPIDDADVTWCRDKIFGADEMYIRAEHIMPLLERVSCNTSTPAEVWEWIKALNAANA